MASVQILKLPGFPESVGKIQVDKCKRLIRINGHRCVFRIVHHLASQLNGFWGNLLDERDDLLGLVAPTLFGCLDISEFFGFDRSLILLI